jgi:hypothetical protein
MDYLLNGLPYFPGTTIFGTGLFDNGTAAAPSLSFSSETNKGFYSPAANQVGLSLNGGLVFTFRQDGGVNPYILGAGGQFMQFLGAGGVNLTAAGSAQNITLTPSGTGQSRFITGGGSYSIFAGQDTASPYGVAIGGIGTIGRIQATQQNVGDSVLLSLNANGGNVLVGTTFNSGALFQIGTNTTTSAGGMVFGTDTFFYRSQIGRLLLSRASAGDTTLRWEAGGVVYGFIGQSGGNTLLGSLTANSLILQTNSITALTLDASQRTILSGALRLANAYVAGAVVGTGYLTIQDSTGTTYRIPVLV